MSRVPVLVRDAAEADAGSLRELWSDLLATPGGELVGLAPTTPEAILSRVAGDADSRLLVAEREGAVVGGAFVRLAALSPLHADRAVFVSHLSVAPSAARRGVGRALVQAVVEWAELLQIERVLVASAVHDREANRFLARRGLAQVAVLRGATVGALRALLPEEHPAPGGSSRRTPRRVSGLVAVRRSRRRADLPAN